MDATYLASRDTTFQDCVELDAQHVWDDGAVRGDGHPDVIGEWLFGCVNRINASVPEQHSIAFGRRPEGIGKQRDLMGRVDRKRREAMVAAAGIWDRARLEVTSAPHSGS